MDEKRLTDSEARQLLERASELDAEQAHSLDVATVREIAAEAGISSAAVDAALRENAVRRPAESAGVGKPRAVPVSRILLILLLGYILFAFVSRVII